MEKYKSHSNGFLIQHFYASLMVIGCILTILIFQSTFEMKKNYENLLSEVNDFSACTRAVSEFQTSCHYLSEQAKFFSLSHEVVYLDKYFYELKSSAKREAALKIVDLSHLEDVPYKNMHLAYKESCKMVETDIYAMRLICDGLEIPTLRLPNEINEVELKEEHVNLSNEEKIKAAQEILFSSTYNDAIQRITNQIIIVFSSLTESHNTKNQKTNHVINGHFASQIIMEIVMFCVCILLYTLLVFFVLIPLQKNFSAITKNKKMELIGAREVLHIAKAYNGLYEKNQITTQVLKHKAEHDNLTGLINRNAFDKIKELLASIEEPIAYLIMDIDFFKNVNDEYGHPVGDLVLKRLAEILKEQFRANDYIIRTGGDEFVVVMTKFSSIEAVSKRIEEKVSNINDILRSSPAGIPVVTVSVGVALSLKGYTPALEKEADVALYNEKGNNRCGVAFYDNIK